LKHQESIVLTWLSWTLLLFDLSFKYFNMIEIIQQNDMNVFVVNGVVIIGFTVSGICKLNIFRRKVEVVQVMNQIRATNSSWGELRYTLVKLCFTFSISYFTRNKILFKGIRWYG